MRPTAKRFWLSFGSTRHPILRGRKARVVPAPMWAGASPVLVQMWAGVSPVLVQIWQGP
jgi:hypothetical protein